MLVRYILRKIPRGLIFQVLDQNPRALDRLPYQHPETKFKVVVAREPELGSGHVYLRGSDETTDYLPTVRWFRNDEERDRYAIQLHTTLQGLHSDLDQELRRGLEHVPLDEIFVI